MIAEWRKRRRQEGCVIFGGLKCFSDFQMSVKHSNFVFVIKIVQNTDRWLEILIMVAYKWKSPDVSH